MDILTNPFKQALRAGKPQIGLWAGGNAYTSEICAGAGFDWLLIDGEHAPNTLQTTLAQLQSVAAYPVAPVVRPAGTTRADQADPGHRRADAAGAHGAVGRGSRRRRRRGALSARRHPRRGQRAGRSSRWNRIPDYLTRANDQMCVLVQIETPRAVDALDDILAVDGVDGAFIGPADLSANMGYLGQPDHPEVTQAIDEAIRRIVQSGKAAGILHSNVERARHYLSLGASFVAVGVDAVLLARAAERLAGEFKNVAAPAPAKDRTSAIVCGPPMKNAHPRCAFFMPGRQAQVRPPRLPPPSTPSTGR